MTKAVPGSTLPIAPVPEFAAAIHRFRSTQPPPATGCCWPMGRRTPMRSCWSSAPTHWTCSSRETNWRKRPLMVQGVEAYLSAEDRTEDRRLLKVYQDDQTRAAPPLRAIRPITAKTAAGVYAKAMVGTRIAYR